MAHASDAGRLPAEVSSFVGRRGELARVRDTLGASRLVTLVGPGGVGKTRLALRAASTVAHTFPAGVHVVELGRLTGPERVGSAVAAAFGLRDRKASSPVEAIADAVRDARALVVLDNCEHVVTAAAHVVAELLAVVPGVRVMATSREPLAVAGEQVVPVLAFPLPSDDGGPRAPRRDDDAITLFVERATAASGAFELTAANRRAVAEICRRLDGLPLAIELAAVRTRALTPEQILERLDDRFALLADGRRDAPPHQRTLWATLEWSHDLLDPAEQALLAALSVFAGPFTLEDAEVVGSATTAAVTGLVSKSLVAAHETGGLACFRLHENVREFGRLRLREAGRTHDVEQRVLTHYLVTCGRFAEQGRHRLTEWLPWVELEIDTIRSALRRALDSAPDAGLTLATSLVWFWVTRATAEGAEVLDELLDRAAAAVRPADAATQAWALFVRGFLAVQQGDPDVAVPALTRAVVAARATADPVVLAQTLAMGAIAATMAGDRTSSAGLLGQAREVAAGTDDVGARLMVLQAGAQTALADGDLEAARSAAARGVALSRETGDLYSHGMMLLNEGFAALLQGDDEAAGSGFVEGLGVARRIDDRVAQCYLVGGLGACASAAGDHARAATLLGAMEGLRVQVGGNAHAAMAPSLARAAAVSASALGGGRFDMAHEAGRRLTREAAVGLALREAGPVDPPSEAEPLLARRETEVAHLVADGLTNKEIGARLFISERTVESHVRNILTKLGFRSRAQIVRWVTEA